jgi:hypothetical protein
MSTDLETINSKSKQIIQIMIRYKLLILLLSFFISCKNSKISNSIVDSLVKSKNPSYLFYGDGDQLQVTKNSEPDFKLHINQEYPYKFLLPYDQGAVDLNNKSYSGSQEKKIIKANLVIDKRLSKNKNLIHEVSNYEKILNKYLYSLNTGLKIVFHYDTTISLPLGRLNTKGKINVDNIQDTLNNAKLLHNGSDFHLVIMQEGDFLSNAAALCLNSRDEIIVLGDKLLIFPPLMLHEIFHGLGLKHVEGKSCGYPSNIMDYRSIGCSHHLLGRQVLMMHFNKYIPPIKNDVSFPSCDDCQKYQGSESMAEQFVNSFDNSVEGVPIAGDHAMMARYAEEIKTGNMPNYIKIALKENYKRQGTLYGFSNADDYSNYCVNMHKKLRLRNLRYWLNNNLEQKGFLPQSSFNYEIVLGYLNSLRSYKNIKLRDSFLIDPETNGSKDENNENQGHVDETLLPEIDINNY